MDERALAERLITYDTSTPEGMQSAAGFVKGWLEARDVEVTGTVHNGRPVLAATVGPEGGPTVVLHGHLDGVRGHAEHFPPWIEGDRLYGRGAYDMKGGLAAMMCAVHDLADQPDVRVRLVIVPDEESEDIDIRYLPNQDPGDILDEIRAIPDIEVKRTFIFPPAHVSRSNPYVRVLSEI